MSAKTTVPFDTTTPLGSMTMDQFRKTLGVYRAKAQTLAGRDTDGKPLGPKIVAFLDALIVKAKDPKAQETTAAFLKRAETDPAMRQQLASVRVETFQNYLLATPNFINFFFEVVNLGPEERPVAQRTTFQETEVIFVGPDGAPKMVRVDKNDDETLINMHFLTTDVVRYKKVDIYRGSIVDNALMTLRMAEDWGNQADGQAKALLLNATPATAGAVGGAFGTFTFTGKRANFTYLANSRIDTRNLPTTNDVQVTINSSGNFDPTANINTKTGQFGFPCLEATIDYAARWAGAFIGGALVPTGRILVAPPAIKGIAKGIVPSGLMRNPISDELLEAGYFGLHYLGRDWTFVPDNTLDPTANQCFPEFNKKPGRVYLKPSLDEEVLSGTSYELMKRNEEERFMRKPFAAYIDSSTRAFLCRINY